MIDPRLILAAVVTGLSAVMLVRFPKTQRKHVLRSILAFFAANAALFLAVQLTDHGYLQSASYLRNLAYVVEGLAVVKIFGDFLFKVLLRIPGMEPEQIFQDIVILAASGLWILVRLRATGVDLSHLVTTSAVLTIVIGFSLQDTLGNVIGGLAVQLDRSVVVGDWVKHDQVMGRVKRITWRHVAIETNNWETVVIPNSILIKNKLTILGRREGEAGLLRRWVYFNVDFRYSPGVVMDAVELSLRRCQIRNVAEKPELNCVLIDFEESYARYAVRYWLTDLSADDGTDSAIREHVVNALGREGISLSIPAHTVFVTEDTEERKYKREQKRIESIARELRDVELFRSFTEDELKHLSLRVKPTPFVLGDIVTRQGAKAHWLYILVEGRVRVILEGEDGSKKYVAELVPGTCFGEMGLMTGEPRAATIEAISDIMCYRLDRESFLDILQSRPEVAEDLSKLLAQRRLELEAVQDDLAGEVSAKRRAQTEADLLDKIRDFFGLS
ncbi:MAG: mechanosensitive ion channel [Deltaproteobacteria bacterium]|nr:mechanosensitive ion channel [Deltaproteobacteria bacterium]